MMMGGQFSTGFDERCRNERASWQNTHLYVNRSFIVSDTLEEMSEGPLFVYFTSILCLSYENVTSASKHRENTQYISAYSVYYGFSLHLLCVFCLNLRKQFVFETNECFDSLPKPRNTHGICIE